MAAIVARLLSWVLSTLTLVYAGCDAAYPMFLRTTASSVIDREGPGIAACFTLGGDQTMVSAMTRPNQGHPYTRYEYATAPE